jgi:hypothetical protein
MKKLLLLLVVLLALVALVAVSCNQTGEVEPPSADMSDGAVPVEPQAFLTADRTNIQPGECVTLEWGVEGEGFFGVELNGQPVDPSGHQQVCPSETTVYTLAIDVGEAMLCREVPVTVAGTGQPQVPAPGQPSQPSQPPQPLPVGCPGAPAFTHFEANPSTITSGQSTVLSWGNVTNGATGPLVGSVVLTPDNFGEVGSPGSVQVSPSTTTTYTLTATGCGGTATKSVTVTVQPQSAGSPPSPPQPSPPGGSATYVTIYDFLDEKNISGATWFDGPALNNIQLANLWYGAYSSYQIETSGIGGHGYIRGDLPNEKLEDGTVCDFLVIRPKLEPQGYIQGRYKIPGYVIGTNDRIQVTYGLLKECWWQKTPCPGTKGSYGLDIWFNVPGGGSTFIVNTYDTHDGKLKSWDTSLSMHAGKVPEEFILQVRTMNGWDEDWACLITTRLVRGGK